MRDTSPEAAAVVRAAVERRPPVERLRDALALSETLRALLRIAGDRVDRAYLERWVAGLAVQAEWKAIQE